MARTHFVKSRRVGKKGEYALNCLTCGKPIEYGQPYQYFTMKLSYGGVKKSYHPNCKIPESHRTTSRMGEIYDAQTASASAIPTTPEDGIDALTSIAEEFAQTVREVGEGYEESADNMESGFGHETEQSSELRERAESLESWASDIENIDFDEFDEDSALEDARNEVDSDPTAEDGDTDRIDSIVDDKRQEWWDEQTEKLDTAINECPC